jgi:putative peptidoglycan lipid II flippase
VLFRSAYRLIQFPIGIFSNALSQAILPTFSAQALEEDNNKLKHTLSFGLRSISFVMVPTSVFFMFFSKTIISALFMGGKFDVYSADTTASVLFFYSIGLFAYGSSKILQSCFFALKDTVTPTKVSGLALIVNITLNFLLMYPLRMAGLALATSISGINTYFILFFKLRKKIGGFDVKEIFISFLKILAASICMGIVCYLISQKQIFSGLGLLNRVLNLGLLLLAGSLSYAIFCFIFRVQEIRQLWQWFLKRIL